MSSLPLTTPLTSAPSTSSASSTASAPSPAKSALTPAAHKSRCTRKCVIIVVVVSVVVAVAAILIGVFSKKLFPKTGARTYTCDAVSHACTASAAPGAVSLEECVKTCGSAAAGVTYYVCTGTSGDTCTAATSAAGLSTVLDFDYPKVKFQTVEGDINVDVAETHVVWTIGTFTTPPDTTSLNLDVRFVIESVDGTGKGRFGYGAMLIDVDAAEAAYSDLTSVFKTAGVFLPKSPNTGTDVGHNGASYNLLHDPTISTPLPNSNYVSPVSPEDPTFFVKHDDGFWYEKTEPQYRSQTGLPYDSVDYNHMIPWVDQNSHGAFSFAGTETRVNDTDVGGRRFALVVYIGVRSNAKYSIRSGGGVPVGGFACSKTTETCVVDATGTLDRGCGGSPCETTFSTCSSTRLTCIPSTAVTGIPWDTCDSFCRGFSNSCFGHGDPVATSCSCYPPYGGDRCNTYPITFDTGPKQYQTKDGENKNGIRGKGQTFGLITIAVFTTSPDTTELRIALNVTAQGIGGSKNGSFQFLGLLVDLDADATDEIDKSTTYMKKYGKYLSTVGSISPEVPNPTDDVGNYDAAYLMGNYVITTELFRSAWADKNDTVNYVMNETSFTKANMQLVGGRRFSIVVGLLCNMNGQIRISSTPGKDSFITFT